MIRFSSIFLLGAMMTQSVMGSANHFVEDDFSGKKYVVQAPESVSVLDLKKAIEDKTGIPAKEQTLFSMYMRKELADDTIYTKYTKANEKIIITRKNINDFPVSISFLGSHQNDVIPKSIVGDLQLEFAPDAMVKDLHTQLEARPELEGHDFVIAVNNMIFTKNDTLLRDYDGKQFQILTFQPQN
jgi:hypothetical protein